MAVQKDFKTGRINLNAGISTKVVDEALTGLEMITVERIGCTPDPRIFITLEVEKTTVYKDIPSTAAAYPASDTNAEVFLCTPVVGVLPEKRWTVTITNKGAVNLTNIDYYIPITKYTGADLARVLA